LGTSQREDERDAGKGGDCCGMIREKS